MNHHFDKIDFNYLLSYYQRYLELKKGKGIDKIGIMQFEEKRDEYLKSIVQKILKKKYKFSLYVEKLILRGKDKKPRILSIPTIKDKIVLNLLKDHIYHYYPECVNRKLPNHYIKTLILSYQNAKIKKIVQLDITDFYPSVLRNNLFFELSRRLPNGYEFALIERAVFNKTVPINYLKKNQKKEIENLGIPQGLPISNVLADIYLSSFDESLGNIDGMIYFRYVDDILLIFQDTCKTKIPDLLRKIRIQLKNKGLRLNSKKYRNLTVDKEYEYLGYRINYPLISVKEASINKLIARIASKFTWFNSNMKLPDTANSRIFSDKARLKYRFIDELNLLISGAYLGSKKYGWLFYFIQINDLKLLFRLDNIVNNFFVKNIYFDQKPNYVKSFVKAYYHIKFKYPSSYIRNYNSYSTLDEKLSFLDKRGYLEDGKHYSGDEIDKIFEIIVLKNISELESDISSFS